MNGSKINKCYRCGKKARSTWNICSDGNKIRWICDSCDIELNKLVLLFMRFRNWKSKINRYKKDKEKHYNEYGEM